MAVCRPKLTAHTGKTTWNMISRNFKAIRGMIKILGMIKKLLGNFIKWIFWINFNFNFNPVPATCRPINTLCGVKFKTWRRGIIMGSFSLAFKVEPFNGQGLRFSSWESQTTEIKKDCMLWRSGDHPILHFVLRPATRNWKGSSTSGQCLCKEKMLSI